MGGASSYKDVFIFFRVVLELAVLRNDFLNDIFSVGSQCIGVVVFTTHTFELVFCVLYLLLLFIVLAFLQTHEILTIDLVQLILDVVDDLCDSRN